MKPKRYRVSKSLARDFNFFKRSYQDEQNSEKRREYLLIPSRHVGEKRRVSFEGKGVFWSVPELSVIFTMMTAFTYEMHAVSTHYLLELDSPWACD